MTQQEFAKYWKERKKNKYYSKAVPVFDKKQTFACFMTELKNLSSSLSLPESKRDFTKLDYEDKITILRKVFGDSKSQFLNNMAYAIKDSIKIGNSVKIKTKEKEKK